MLASQRDVFVLVVAVDKNKRVLGTEIRDGSGDSVTGDAKSAHQLAVLIKRNAAGRAIERCVWDRLDHLTRSRATGDYAVGATELVDVGNERAVDLERIDGQRAQVGERGEAGAEIVEYDARTIFVEHRDRILRMI